MDRIYTITEWITRFLLLNLYWILFSLVGLVFLGVFPATTAMFSISRKWIQGDIDIPIFKTFWSYFRSDFLKANMLGFLLIILGFGLYVDFVYVKSLNSALGIILLGSTLLLTALFIITILNLFPIYAHYELNIFQYIQRAFSIGILHPIRTIMMALGVIGIYFISSAFPGFIIFFSGSLLSYLITWIASRNFSDVIEGN
ncbi:YesL family protein [Bacillus sp. SM2101]|uniref:YesL family protein n=1 Tax=Bacillus sp. SM2101 TaxID=2805366 RepID=UPI001BDF1803|nr:YesL family protein [Bacillus sp. SM2101]